MPVKLSVEISALEAPKTIWVGIMELLELVRGVFQICWGFSDVVLWPVTNPLYEVVQLPSDNLGVKDAVHFVVVLIIHLKEGGLLRVLSGEGVWSMLFEESDMEHGVKSFQPWREVKTIGM